MLKGISSWGKGEAHPLCMKSVSTTPNPLFQPSNPCASPSLQLETVSCKPVSLSIMGPPHQPDVRIRRVPAGQLGSCKPRDALPGGTLRGTSACALQPRLQVVAMCVSVCGPGCAVNATTPALHAAAMPARLECGGVCLRRLWHATRTQVRGHHAPPRRRPSGRRASQPRWRVLARQLDPGAIVLDGCVV
jgi:hypothetical protein